MQRLLACLRASRNAAKRKFNIEIIFIKSSVELFYVLKFQLCTRARA